MKAALAIKRIILFTVKEKLVLAKETPLKIKINPIANNKDIANVLIAAFNPFFL